MALELHTDIIRTPSGFLKIFETALTIVAISVSEGTSDFSFGNDDRTFFCGGVLVLSVVVTPLLFLTYLKGAAKEIQRTPFEVLVNLVQGAFMLSAGSVIINTSCTHLKDVPWAADAGKTAGSFCIINSLLYFLDTFFAFQNLS
ncbi:uncharacterized protein [Procambarus clarkii]|uniref:uncharacterized protein n=1 Tax=Procambarus clarkii TaxID=6728 RepID=UPI001E67180F|nr:uncharacterized protein LOC123761583 [Procambarus clarkii]